MRTTFGAFLSLALLAAIGANAEAIEKPIEDPIEKGLILDLNADKGVGTEDGRRVWRWNNQVSPTDAKVFIKRNKGRDVAGSGRPKLKPSVEAIGGHDTVVFHRQELVNHDEDAFDHLITGNGYTWFSVMAVYQQVAGLKDVNSFFGNLRNGGNFEGFWAGLNDDNTVWAGTRNGVTFGRWDKNNPKVIGPKLETRQYYVVAGRMEAGTGTVRIELFVNDAEAVAAEPVPINSDADSSKMAVGQERDATNHPGRESFDGEITRFLVYERPLARPELERVFKALKEKYQIGSN